MRRLVLYGGSFNPPTLAHQAVERQLKDRFDRVVMLPCGIRPDKWQTNVVDPIHRANMAELAFRGLGAEVDLSDLEREKFLTTVELDALWKSRVGPGWEVWHAVGSELIAGGAGGDVRDPAPLEPGPAGMERTQLRHPAAPLAPGRTGRPPAAQRSPLRPPPRPFKHGGAPRVRGRDAGPVRNAQARRGVRGPLRAVCRIVRRTEAGKARPSARPEAADDPERAQRARGPHRRGHRR